MWIFIALPIYIAVFVLSIKLASKTAKSTDQQFNTYSQGRFLLIGFLSALTFTLICVEVAPVAHRSDDWGHAILLFGIVMTVPVGMGLLFSSLTSSESITQAKLAAIAVGAFWATGPSPFVVPILNIGYTLASEYFDYKFHCGNAKVELIEKVVQANSVAILPDSVLEPPSSTRTAYHQSLSIRLLNHGLFDYVERPVTGMSGLKGIANYERVRIKGEKRVITDTQEYAYNYLYEPVSAISSEYVVKATELLEPDRTKKALGEVKGSWGASIEVYRRVDEKVISRAQYYGNDTLRSFCPTIGQPEIFTLSFVLDSLGSRNPKSFIPSLLN
jgi:hypothetical protein